jgi:hypothetical protein
VPPRPAAPSEPYQDVAPLSDLPDEEDPGQDLADLPDEAQNIEQGAVTPEASSAPVDLEKEREAILRMIAEGRITPEEGDLLLEALG